MYNFAFRNWKVSFAIITFGGKISKAVNFGIILRNSFAARTSQSRLEPCAFRARKNAAPREECEIIFLDGLYRTAKRAVSKMPLAIPAACTEKKKKKKGKRREKKERARGSTNSRGHSLNDSTILGHSSKRHNASSMTGNARFRWNQVRREPRIKCEGTRLNRSQ